MTWASESIDAPTTQYNADGEMIEHTTTPMSIDDEKPTVMIKVCQHAKGYQKIDGKLCVLFVQ
jgi:hypothetical protein